MCSDKQPKIKETTMKEAQLKKVGILFDAIDAVVNDPEIPIDQVMVVRQDGTVGTVTTGNHPKASRSSKREYTEEELQERATEHARLSNAIESYRIHEFQENGKLYVTTTHLAAALKKTKYDVINHLKDLVKNGTLKYIIKSFNIKEDNPDYVKNVKLIDFNELADIERTAGGVLFADSQVKDIITAIKNGIQGSEDMVSPM